MKNKTFTLEEIEAFVQEHMRQKTNEELEQINSYMTNGESFAHGMIEGLINGICIFCDGEVEGIEIPEEIKDPYHGYIVEDDRDGDSDNYHRNVIKRPDGTIVAEGIYDYQLKDVLKSLPPLNIYRHKHKSKK